MSLTTLSENNENTCVVCFKNVSIYSIGECDHPVCYECSTRMRVLCRQNECPICRQDMPKVIFTKNVLPFKNIKNKPYLMDKTFKICFEDAEIQSAYSKLLEHVCTVCPGRPAFRTFQNLKDHMRKEHELHYCDLCVDNLKIFTFERRCYTRQELAQHRRKGDPDDRSHRGHPLCEFCDQRYMDNDELFRHLRRDHLFCHFCDADGYHQYYSSYDYLREHFRTDHFLCEEGNCVDEKFTPAFRTEIDLKAHRALVHGRTMGKAAAKQARTLELEFTLAPRPRPERGGPVGAGRAGPRGRAREEEGAVGPPTQDDFADGPVIAANAALRTNCPAEFPTLSGAPAVFTPTITSSRHNGVGGVTIRSVRQQPLLAVTDKNFPALGGGNAGAAAVASSTPDPNATSPATVRVSVNSERAADGLSIRVNRRAEAHSGGQRGASAATAAGGSVRLRTDDFPSLGGTVGPPGSVAAGQWLHVDRGGRPRAQAPPQAAAPPPKIKMRPEDFPSLTPRAPPASQTNESRKKATSVVIPVTPTSTWLHSNGPTQPTEAATAAALPAATPTPAPSSKHDLVEFATIKVKSKKKKQQQQQQQQQQKKNSVTDGTGKEPGKRKKREDASGSESSLATFAKGALVRSGEEEITSKLEGVLTCKESSGDGGASSSSSACNADAAQRKRSELIIASLRSERAAPPPPESRSTHPVHHTDDFPALGCPPGFSSSTAAPPPPPGFATASGPPPGFSSVTVNSVARAPAPPGGNGLTFTSSSGRSYPILPRAAPSAMAATAGAASGAAFVPPRDVERRNQALVARVQRVVPLEDFLQLSALFRQGALPALTFRSHCQHLLGEEVFADVFPELLALLPDIEKQQELLAAHEAEEGIESLPVQVCASCGQVLASGDLKLHQATHHLENHFAAKVPTSKTSASTVNAWDCKK